MPTPINNATILLCPGQGAQHVGMGKAWAESSPLAREVFEQADDVLDMPLSRLCFEGPACELNRTDIAQAAIYTTTVACFRALADRAGLTTAAAGLSLGEFSALHLAGAFDFLDGLRLVRVRGQAMQEAAQERSSTMLAVTGDTDEQRINDLCDRARGRGVLVPANFNSPMQVVLSGSVDACETAMGVADQMGFKPTALAVAGAFHSPLMRPAADRLSAALDRVQWSRPNVPVISNVSARPHDPSIASIKRRLVEQLTSPVRWSQSMQWALMNLSGRYVELAPGRVLSGLMRRISRRTTVVNFAEPPPAAGD